MNHFVAGQKVDVVGVSQGKGFSGAMKRHNFGGMQAFMVFHKSQVPWFYRKQPRSGRTWKGKKDGWSIWKC